MEEEQSIQQDIPIQKNVRDVPVVEEKVPDSTAGVPAKRTCKLFMKRKNRFCKFECFESLDYCHFHAHENANNSSILTPLSSTTTATSLKKEELISEILDRVPCPLDPNHSVQASKLEKHLKVCSAMRQQESTESMVWFSKGINNKTGLSEAKQLELLKDIGENEETSSSNAASNSSTNAGTAGSSSLQSSKKYLQQLYAVKDKNLVELIAKIEANFAKAVSLYKEKANVEEMNEAELSAYLLDLHVIDEDDDVDAADTEKIIKKFKADNQNFTDTQRDHRQVCKLVDVMKQQNLAKFNHIFIEFGAGKGLLSHGIAISLQLPEGQQLSSDALMESLRNNSINSKDGLKKQQMMSRNKIAQNNQNSNEDTRSEQIQEERIQTVPADQTKSYACHVLLELESRRNKLDRLHRENPYFLRYRTNILDFNVNSLQTILAEKKYPYLSEESLKVVGVSKHMCGGATDLSINTLLNCADPHRFEGMLIATCCHHRCTYDTYTNTEFLLGQLGYAKEELDLLFNCSSWYASGLLKEEIMRKIENTNSNEKQTTTISNMTNIKETYSVGGKTEWLTAERKSKIGKMVKRTLDIGRLLNLIEKGKTGRIIKYCDFVLSPENFVIVAK